MPAGLEERLRPFGTERGWTTVYTLGIHDLAASKLIAGREKDFGFLRVLLERCLMEFSTLMERMRILRSTAYRNAVADCLRKLATHLREWRMEELARVAETEGNGENL